MKNGIRTTYKEELVRNYKLSPVEKKMKKDKQDKFNKQKGKHGKK